MTIFDDYQAALDEIHGPIYCEHIIHTEQHHSEYNSNGYRTVIGLFNKETFVGFHVRVGYRDIRGMKLKEPVVGG